MTGANDSRPPKPATDIEQLEAENTRLIAEVGALKGVVDFKDKEIEKLEEENILLEEKIEWQKEQLDGYGIQVSEQDEEIDRLKVMLREGIKIFGIQELEAKDIIMQVDKAEAWLQKAKKALEE